MLPFNYFVKYFFKLQLREKIIFFVFVNFPETIFSHKNQRHPNWGWTKEFGVRAELHGVLVRAL